MWQAAAHRLVRGSAWLRGGAGATGIVLAVAACTGTAATPSLGEPTASGSTAGTSIAPDAGSPSGATLGTLEATIAFRPRAT